MDCPGCDGKRWVDSKHRGPTTCPVCKGTGSMDKADKPKVDPMKYNQDKVWTLLVRQGATAFDSKLEEELKKITDKEDKATIVVHLLFDKNITPAGSLYFDQVYGATITGPAKEYQTDPLILASKNYSLLENGQIDTVSDVPVSPMFRLIQRISTQPGWGFESVHLDPNRKGNPLFTDNSMMAIGITGALDIVKSGLKRMLNLLRDTAEADNQCLLVNLSVENYDMDLGIREMSKGL